MTIEPKILLFAMVLLMSLSIPSLGTPQVPEDAMQTRAEVSAGDTARLKQVFAKARRGETVRIAVIGGSITQGASATAPDKRYGNRIYQWWKDTFPKATIEFTNAGIGATGSNYGALRAQRDLLSHHPDFVVMEYGVNDGNSQEFAETLEGLVRQTLRQPEKPAVVLLFMMHQGGGNAQEWHSKVGTHYGLPMISYRDGLWPEIAAGRMKWEAVMADQVHPNDAGHAYAAQFVTHFLEKTLAATPEKGRLPAVAKVPKPLFTDLFEKAHLYEATDLKPVSQKGWTLVPAERCWKADQPGSVLEFEVEGRLIYTMSFRIRGPMGRIRVQVDAQPPVTIDGWFDQTWGGYQTTDVVARDLKPGKHRVRIEVQEDKAADSTGHEVKLFGLGAAG